MSNNPNDLPRFGVQPGAGQPQPGMPSGFDRSDPGDLPRLGSLAQAARGKHIKQARTTLLVIGILTIVVNVAMYFVESGNLKSSLEKEIRKRTGPGFVIDQAKFKEVEETTRRILLLIYGGAVLAGVVFVILAFFVEQYPVPITALGLILYIGLNILFAALAVMGGAENAGAVIASGWWVKIIVIVFLVKALQAGIAAQNEKRAAEAAAEFGA